MEIQFLGTGAGVLTKHRNVTGIALKLLDERNAVWLFDCGEGTQLQILKVVFAQEKLKRFLLHIYMGIIFLVYLVLLSSRSFQGGTEPLEIYGPVGVADFVKTSLRVSQSRLSYPLKFIELTKENDVIFKDKQFTVRCNILDHGITSFGYRIEEAGMKENYK